MAERATVTRGPRGATGGHQWTRRTPGAQEATYDKARYEMQVRGRQASEEAAVSEREAAAARSGALTEHPMAPEMAEVAAAVGEQRARAQPEMMSMEAAQNAFDSYRRKAELIDADPNLTPEEKRAARRDAEREAWMAIIAVQPRARKPEEDMLYGAMGSGEPLEEAD